MREILFRGKSRENGNWVEGCLICANEYCCILQDEEKVHPTEYPYLGAKTGCIDGYATPVILETVGQYTGLKDKNGKKIFEGDLCLCNRHINSSIDKQVFHISFETKSGQWIGNGWSSYIEAEQFSMCEVIGNIHDNPELLKEGAK